MRLTIGSFTLDGAAASSTVTSASLRLDMDRPFVPVIRGNELRIEGLRAYVEAANEGALKTALDTFRTNFDQASGKDITYYNTTGTALFAMLTLDWPEAEIEYDIDHGDVNAVVTFTIVGRRPAPPAGGSADETGQVGEIEWELELGPNRLTGATATAEFKPTTGATAVENASAWAAKMLASPPTSVPAFFGSRLRAVTAVFRALEQPNQSSATYNPAIISVLFREAYAGLASIPAQCTDWNVNVDVVNSEAMDVNAGEGVGPAIIVLHGWFTLHTEAPTSFVSGATKVARGSIYSTGVNIYDQIEGDFRAVYAESTLHELGAPEISIGLDSGRVTFRRAFSTTRVLVWKESTTLMNVDPVMINRDYKGRDIVHRGAGGPVATVVHSLYIEALDPKPYITPRLGTDWVRLDQSQDVTIDAKIKGNTLVHTTRGTSTWRYANPSERPGGPPTSAGGKVLTLANIGNGEL